MDSKIRNKQAVIVSNMLKDMILHGKPFPMPPEFKEQLIPRIAELLSGPERDRS